MCNFTGEKISSRAGIDLRTARSVGQRLTHQATRAPPSNNCNMFMLLFGFQKLFYLTKLKLFFTHPGSVVAGSVIKVAVQCHPCQKITFISSCQLILNLYHLKENTHLIKSLLEIVELDERFNLLKIS